jgi:hypothetical protein
MRRALVTALLMLLPTPALAQESLGQGEVVVTGTRREADGYDASMPAVGLRRRADFAI